MCLASLARETNFHLTSFQKDVDFVFQMQSRLNFLQYIYCCSSDLMIAQKHIDILWESFVTNAVSRADDSDLLLQWLKAVRKQQKPHAVSHEVTNYIFQTYLCDPKKLDFETLTPYM